MPGTGPRSMMRSRVDKMVADRVLRSHALRVTPARRALLAFLTRQRQHPNAEAIFDGLRRAGTPLSIATLYQNLNMLTARGVLKRFAGGDGVMRYDVNLHAHHHLVCEQCGRIVDVEVTDADAVTPVLIHGATLGPRGWRVRLRQVEFRGICPDCQDPAGHPPGAPAS